MALEMHGWTSARRQLVGRWLLALVVVGSVLALGAIHTPVLVVVALASVAAMALCWWDADAVTLRSSAQTILLVGVGLTIWTALQTVPLPRGVLAAIAGGNADVWDRSLVALREPGPAWAPISLDPVAGRVQVLRGLTYLAAFAAALRVARDREGCMFLERLLAASSLTFAATTVAHGAVGATHVFGVYAPRERYAYYATHLGPLLNTNHMAAYTNVGLLVSFGALVEERRSIPRPVAGVSVALLGAMTVWTASRGGVATMMLGALLVVLLVLRSRRGRVAAGGLFTAAAAAVFALLLAIAAFDATRAKFLQNDMQKLDLVQSSAELLRTYGWLGAGRGTFESVYPAVRRGTEYWVFTHPENVVMQWTIEWGIPIGVVALAALAWSLRPRTALARTRPPCGAWAALVALGLHNLADFSAEIPAVVLALAVCAALVTGGTSGVPSGQAARWARRPQRLSLALVAVTAAVCAATLPASGLELYEERRAVESAGLDRSLPREELRSRLRAAMLRHPAEPYFPFVGGVRASVDGGESVIPWIGRALERSPVYGRAHLVLARALYRRSPSQARLEYRIACAQDRQQCQFDEAALLVHDTDEAMELVPEGDRGAVALARLSELLAARLPATVVRLDAELSSRDPLALPPRRRLAEAAIADVRNDEAWCKGAARAACIAGGLAAAEQVRAAKPDLCVGHALVAELRALAGEVEAALVELDRAIATVEDSSACARRAVALARATGRRAQIDASVDRLLKVSCATAECGDNLLVAADVMAAQGNTRRAIALRRTAWERSPEREDLLVAIARQAEAAGFHGEALDAYTRLAERHPGDPQWAAAVQRERDAVARGLHLDGR